MIALNFRPHFIMVDAVGVGMDAGNMLDLTSYKSDKRAMLAGKILVLQKRRI